MCVWERERERERERDEDKEWVEMCVCESEWVSKWKEKTSIMSGWKCLREREREREREKSKG